LKGWARRPPLRTRTAEMPCFAPKLLFLGNSLPREKQKLPRVASGQLWIAE
jgi:hypothetical protein